MPNENKKKKKDPSPEVAAPPPAAPSPAAAPPASAEALAQIKSEMAAIAPANFATINVDIPQAVAVVLGVVPHLRELRGQLVAALPQHPMAGFDMLETYALAAYHAHILWLPPEASANRVAALLEEVNPLRENLLGDAEALARRKLLDGDTIAEIRANTGSIDKANDLVALSGVFTKNWAAIHDKTPTTLEEVRRAGELGPLLLAALGIREHAVALAPDAVADQRRRAFTLFFRTYDETRRAITYLRWHEGDADQLAPSLYKGRGGRTPGIKEGAADTVVAEDASAETTDAGGAGGAAKGPKG